MKKKIKTDNGEEEIELANPKGKHTKKGFKLLMASRNKDDTENISAVDKYTDYLDEVACWGSGKDQDWLDELDDEEKQKIVSFYHDKVMAKFDFLKSSSKQQSSVQKATVQ